MFLLTPFYKGPFPTPSLDEVFYVEQPLAVNVAQKALKELNEIVAESSRNMGLIGFTCILSSAGLISGSFLTLPVLPAFLLSLFLGVPSCGYGGANLGIENPYIAWKDSILDFTSEFNKFVKDPEEIKLIPLFVCYQKVAGFAAEKKVTLSFELELMATLMTCLDSKKLNGTTLVAWKELLNNFGKEDFMIQNNNFWNKLNMKAPILDSYHSLVYKKQPIKHIPHAIINIFIKTLEENTSLNKWNCDAHNVSTK